FLVVLTPQAAVLETARRLSFCPHAANGPLLFGAPAPCSTTVSRIFSSGGSTHEPPPPRLGRPRARARLEDGGEPADRPPLLRPRHCRHRAGGRQHRPRHRRPPPPEPQQR